MMMMMMIGLNPVDISVCEQLYNASWTVKRSRTLIMWRILR